MLPEVAENGSVTTKIAPQSLTAGNQRIHGDGR
jgi:hypothetical protein